MKNQPLFTSCDFIDKTPPKRIHFIWVGSSVPDKYLIHTIIKMSLLAKRSQFEFNLWVDNDRNFTHAFSNLKINGFQFDIMAKPADLGIRLRPIQSLISSMKQDRFYQKNNHLKAFCHDVSREMVGFKNLAAAADFLRYEILRQEGGFYFDTDTIFNYDPRSLLKSENLPLGIKINATLTSRECCYNNDIIATIAHHPALENAIHFALKRYVALDCEKVNPKENPEYFGRFFRVNPISCRMDAKRYPYHPAKFGSDNQYSSERFIQTLDASGPRALFEGITTFLCDYFELDDTYSKEFRAAFKAIEIKPYMEFILKEPSTDFPKKRCLSLAGIKLYSAADKTWAIIIKPNKVYAFDDCSINPLSVFK